MITAIVNENRKDVGGGPPVWYLHVPKQEGVGLPNRDGKRTAITLVIRGKEYIGNIGSRSDFPYIYISPTLVEVGGKHEKRQLATVLQAERINKTDRVSLSVSGTTITVHV
jgi:hypothetical protein